MIRRLLRKPSKGQAILFTPVALMAGACLLAAYNSLAHPVVAVAESADERFEAVVFLRHPWSYPFYGEVESCLDLRSLPSRRTILEKRLATHRWASEASNTYREIEWAAENRLVLYSQDRRKRHSVVFHLEARHVPDGAGTRGSKADR